MIDPEGIPLPLVEGGYPTAFISYSWDDETHKAWVKELATQLRADGIDVHLDHWHTVPAINCQNSWSAKSGETNMSSSCAHQYKAKSEGRMGGGMSAGIDYRVTNSLAVGLFGGYSHTWTDLRPGSIDVDTGRGGLYGTYFDSQGWWVNAGVWGGYNSYSTSRQALLGPANGSTNGYEVSTFGDAGYDIHCGNLTFGPIVAMQYTTVHIGSFSEHGSLVPLNVHSDSEDSFRTDAGRGPPTPGMRETL